MGPLARPAIRNRRACVFYEFPLKAIDSTISFSLSSHQLIMTELWFSALVAQQIVGASYERSGHQSILAMVSLARPAAVASTYRLEPRMDVRRLRSILAHSHRWFCAASTLRSFAVPAHSPLCRRGPGDNRIRLGNRRPAWRCARRLSRSQAIDDSCDSGLFRVDGLECALLGLAVFCG